MSESAISTTIINWVNSLPDARARKVHQSALAGKGEPDIDACIAGRCVKIETKQIAGNTPTRLQVQVLAEWRRAGAVAIWATSLAGVKEQLAEHGIHR